MNTTVSELNILKALRNSLPFCAQFIKQHWILFIVYLLIGFIPVVFFKDQSWNITKILVECISLVFFYVIYYYAVKMATPQLDSTAQLSNKSLLKTLWQLLVVLLITTIAAFPLFLLFLIPGIWWMIKIYLASINLVNTDSGILESVKESFQMTKGKFWQSLGFIAGTVLILLVIALIAAVPISFFLQLSILHDWSWQSIFNLAYVIPSAIAGIISCFRDTWLYIYLKDNNQNLMPSQ
jgi:hypothetical protein